MKNNTSLFTFSIASALFISILSGCTGSGRSTGRGRGNLQDRQLNFQNGGVGSGFGANGRLALVLLKRNGKSQGQYGSQAGDGRLYPGSNAGGSGTGTYGGTTGTPGSGGPLYGGANQGNQQPNITNVPNPGNNLPQKPEGLHVVHMYNNGINGVSSYLFQGQLTNTFLPMQLDKDSDVAVTNDGSGYIVSQPREGFVYVGQWDKSGALNPLDRIPFRNPNKVTCGRTSEGELCAVAHDGGLIGFLGVGVTRSGQLEFLKLRESFRPAGAADIITDVVFSPGGQYIYFGTATHTSGLGQLVVCEMSTVMRIPQNVQRAAAESSAFGSGCFPGDPGLGYQGQQGYAQRQAIINPVYVGTQSLSFVPHNLIVSWSMVGALNNKLGPMILVNPNTGEHDSYLSNKLNVVGPTQVRNYQPFPLGNPNGGTSVFGYNYRFAVPHSRNNDIVLFGNRQGTTQSFMKVLSTENRENLGKELDNYDLGDGLVTTVAQDIGRLNDDYTASLNGDFVLVGRDTGVIHIMSYVEGFKSLTFNGSRYDIPVYGFDPISIAVRTSTPFAQTNIRIEDLVANKNDADAENPGS